MGFQNKLVICSNYFIEITSPTDGETINSGNDLEIQWNHKEVKKVKLIYSTDQGNTWNNIANNINANGRSYKWTADVSSSTGALFRITDDDNSQLYDVVSLFITTASAVTSISDMNELPVQYQLYQNYPNPFNPTTTIRYGVTVTGNLSGQQVTLKVFNLPGNEITTLVKDVQSPGYYERTWNAVNMPSGIYFSVLKAGSFTEVKKMILLK